MHIQRRKEVMPAIWEIYHISSLLYKDVLHTKLVVYTASTEKVQSTQKTRVSFTFSMRMNTNNWGLATGRWQQMSARTTEKQTPCSSGAGHWRKPPEYICIFRRMKRIKSWLNWQIIELITFTLKDNSYICTFVLLDRMEWDILFSVVGK